MTPTLCCLSQPPLTLLKCRETRVRTLLPSCGAEVPRRTTHHLRGTPFSACEAFQFPGSSDFPEAAPALWPSQSDCGQTKILPFPGGLANAQLLADLERGARKGDGQRGERGKCRTRTGALLLLHLAALFGQLSWLTKRNCKKTKTKGAYREAATQSAGVERRLHRSQRHCKARSMRGVNGASPFFTSLF
ncbi:hypothetical protein Q8A73_016870 [Channa argus]|nr:hypothetical protein Q8A73_016870 [Channa argus]